MDPSKASDRKVLPANAKYGKYSSSADLPEGAVLVTREQVLMKYYDVLSNWRPRKDVWPYTVGFGALAAIACSTAYTVSFTLRLRLKVGPSSMGSHIPTMVLPLLGVGSLHHGMVQVPLMLREEPCLTCMQVRAMSIQAACGWVLPCSLAYLSSVVTANAKSAMKIPGLFDFKKMTPFMAKIIKPYKPVYVGLLVLNVLAAYFVTTKEAQMVSFFEQQAFGHLEQHDGQEEQHMSDS